MGRGVLKHVLNGDLNKFRIDRPNVCANFIIN